MYYMRFSFKGVRLSIYHNQTPESNRSNILTSMHIYRFNIYNNKNNYYVYKRALFSMKFSMKEKIDYGRLDGK